MNGKDTVASVVELATIALFIGGIMFGPQTATLPLVAALSSFVSARFATRHNSKGDS